MSERTAFVDGETLRAMEQGVRRIVIVGAGNDSRTLRFRRSGVDFFEVDHVAKQADKRQRLETLEIPLDHMTFVPIDAIFDRLEADFGGMKYLHDEPGLSLCERVIRAPMRSLFLVV